MKKAKNILIRLGPEIVRSDGPIIYNSASWLGDAELEIVVCSDKFVGTARIVELLNS